MADEPVNPFDPAALRADASDDDIATRRIIHHVNVRKPNKQEFFRVNPDPAFSQPVYMIEIGEGIETEKYVVAPALAKEIIAETSRRQLFVCVNRAGKAFIWPCKLPSGTANPWVDTALEIAESAKSFWVRLIPDIPGRQYEESRAEDYKEEPKWPDLTFGEMLALGFKNKLI